MSVRRRSWFAWAFAVSFGLSCGGGDGGSTGPDDDPPDDGVGVSSTRDITPGGGTFSFVDSLVTLVVPAGALSEAVQITVTSLDTVGVPRGVAGALFDFRPDGLEFLQPVDLTVQYEIVRLPLGLTEDFLRLFEFTSGMPQLVVGALWDRDANTVSGQISGFSAFGAGEATPDELVGGIEELGTRAEDAQGAELERIQEVVAQDIAVVDPRIEQQCVASDILQQKILLMNQLILMQGVADQLGLDGIRDDTELCGGLLDADSTSVAITPDTIRMRPGEAIQLEGAIIGPNDQELFGQIEWAAGPQDIITIDGGSGLATGVMTGEGFVFAASSDLPIISSTVDATVVDVLLVEISPAALTVGLIQQDLLNATVRDSTTGTVSDEFGVDWSAASADLVSLAITGAPDPNGVFVTGDDLGTTDVMACVQGFGEEFCGTGSVEVVYNLQGTWSFTETLTVDVDAPATETCEVGGTVTLSQAGDTYSGTSSETVTCTFDPGDGTDPDVDVVQLTGMIRNGVISQNSFTHETIFATEACRTSGTLISTLTAGFADMATGTTECLDENDFFSTGPMTADWISGSRGSPGR